MQKLYFQNQGIFTTVNLPISGICVPLLPMNNFLNDGKLEVQYYPYEERYYIRVRRIGASNFIETISFHKDGVILSHNFRLMQK